MVVQLPLSVITGALFKKHMLELETLVSTLISSEK